MQDIEYRISKYNQDIYRAEEVDLERYPLPPKRRLFNISISIGTNEQTTITGKFVYLAEPITREGVDISVEDQLKVVEKELSNIKDIYRGKAKYSVVEENPGTKKVVNPI